jgi:hypothetical protein
MHRSLSKVALRSVGQLMSRNGVSARAMSVVPFKLADIGEGIAEVELLKWFVKVGS